MVPNGAEMPLGLVALGPEPPATDQAEFSARSSRRGFRLGPWKIWRWRIGTVPRLIAGLSIVTAAVFGLVSVQVAQTFKSHALGITRGILIDDLGEYSRALEAAPGSSIFSTTSRYLASHQVDASRAIMVGIKGGATLGSRGSEQLLKSSQVKAWLAAAPASTVVQGVPAGNKHYLVLASPIRQGTRLVGVFIAAADETSLLAESRQVMLLAIAEAAIAVAFTVGAGYLLLRRVLGMVGGITSTAAGIADGDLSRRLDYSGPDDEMGTMAKTFDYMIDRLDATVAEQRRLLSDVSHQLKTPLTIVRGNLELIERLGEPLSPENQESLQYALEEIQYMSRLIDQLLMLGRTMERDFLQTEPVDLRAFMADVFAAASVMAPRSWSYAEPPDLVLLIDAPKLRGAILNLVENAVKATGEGDEIEIAARADQHLLTISVGDSGPGVPPGMEASIFGRFERGSRTYAKGAGLGLSIVDAVARAHSGAALVGRSRLGGAEFSVVLPLSLANGYGAVEEHT
ncbi:MAG: HAMP domain-containing sensor histidine kinase [Actinomycetota bacterium]|nr:HAMP domain-containing sensor histidine kinase [Actinomycetota bacterium]